MTTSPDLSALAPAAGGDPVAVTDPALLPALPGRTMSPQELQCWVAELAQQPEVWEHLVEHDTGRRHYASLYRDSDIDVWVLCWNVVDDTGWHDHDISSGAVAVTRGAIAEAHLRLGDEPGTRVVEAGRAFAFGPDHIHRMSGAVDGSVSLHAYSPPLWRMGQYSIDVSGALRRSSVSCADELRPIGDRAVVAEHRRLQAVADDLVGSTGDQR